MKKHTRSLPLGSFLNLVQAANLAPDYQRGVVWGKAQQELLIDTIARDYIVPEIILREIEEDKYEMVDGVQRSTAIMKFLNNKIVLGDVDVKGFSVKGKKYKDLTPEQKYYFDSRELHLVIINGSKEEVERMFKRLQNGSPLKAQEKRNAMSGQLREFVRLASNHDFFESCQFNDSRGTYAEVICQFILIEVKPEAELKLSNAEIDKYYEENILTGVSEKVEETIINTMDFLQNCFPDKKQFVDKAMLKKTTVHSLYMVASELIKQNGYNKMENYIGMFANWFFNFEAERKIQEEKAEKDRLPMYAKYLKFITSGTGNNTSLRGRKAILLDSWNEYLKAHQDEVNRIEDSCVFDQNSNSEEQKTA